MSSTSIVTVWKRSPSSSSKPSTTTRSQSRRTPSSGPNPQRPKRSGGERNCISPGHSGRAGVKAHFAASRRCPSPLRYASSHRGPAAYALSASRRETASRSIGSLKVARRPPRERDQIHTPAALPSRPREPGAAAPTPTARRTRAGAARAPLSRLAPPSSTRPSAFCESSQHRGARQTVSVTLPRHEGHEGVRPTGPPTHCAQSVSAAPPLRRSGPGQLPPAGPRRHRAGSDVHHPEPEGGDAIRGVRGVLAEIPPPPARFLLTHIRFARRTRCFSASTPRTSWCAGPRSPSSPPSPQRRSTSSRPSPTSSRPRKGCRPCASTTRPSPSLTCSLRSDDMISRLAISTCPAKVSAPLALQSLRGDDMISRRLETSSCPALVSHLPQKDRSIPILHDTERALISHTY